MTDRALKEMEDLVTERVKMWPGAGQLLADIVEIVRVSYEAGKEAAVPAQGSPDSVREALRLIGAEDERQTRLHELLETIREQIRVGVAPEHRPDGLFKNIQDAVYVMRGRTPLLNDAAIVGAFDAIHAEGLTGSADYDHGYGVGYEHGVKSQEQEIERLRQRLGPRGLEVVMIDGAGHYVNEKVKAEIERLRGQSPAVKVVEGTTDEVDAAACLIWSELCPGMVMGDDDRPHYEAAAKAVLALRSQPVSERLYTQAECVEALKQAIAQLTSTDSQP